MTVREPIAPVLQDALQHTVLENIFKTVPGLLPGEAYRAAREVLDSERRRGEYSFHELEVYARTWAALARTHEHALRWLQEAATRVPVDVLVDPMMSREELVRWVSWREASNWANEVDEALSADTA